MCSRAGSCKKHDFWNNSVHPIKNYISGILRLKPIDWYMHGTDPRRGGGWLRGGSTFLDTPSRKFLGHFYRILKTPISS